MLSDLMKEDLIKGLLDIFLEILRQLYFMVQLPEMKVRRRVILILRLL